jgi:hypothetical protein
LSWPKLVVTLGRLLLLLFPPETKPNACKDEDSKDDSNDDDSGGSGTHPAFVEIFIGGKGASRHKASTEAMGN